MVASVPELTKRSFRLIGNRRKRARRDPGLSGRRSAQAGRVARCSLMALTTAERRGPESSAPEPSSRCTGPSASVEPGALSALDKTARAPHCAKSPHGRVDAAGKEALGALLQTQGTGCGGGFGAWELIVVNLFNVRNLLSEANRYWVINRSGSGTLLYILSQGAMM